MEIQREREYMRWSQNIVTDDAVSLLLPTFLSNCISNLPLQHTFPIYSLTFPRTDTREKVRDKGISNNEGRRREIERERDSGDRGRQRRQRIYRWRQDV